MKLCDCGCGNPAPIATGTYRKAGRIKGQPTRFIKGHAARLMTGPANGGWKGGRSLTVSGYVMVMAPGHPRQNVNGYVYEHILVVERALGRFLVEPEQVHHVNGVKTDNRPCNLVVCPDSAYHQILHLRTRALEACGKANWRRCHFCQQYGDPMQMGAAKRTYHHRECRNARHRERAALSKADGAA